MDIPEVWSFLQVGSYSIEVVCNYFTAFLPIMSGIGTDWVRLAELREDAAAEEVGVAEAVRDRSRAHAVLASAAAHCDLLSAGWNSQHGRAA